VAAELRPAAHNIQCLAAEAARLPAGADMSGRREEEAGKSQASRNPNGESPAARPRRAQFPGWWRAQQQSTYSSTTTCHTQVGWPQKRVGS